MPSQYTPGEMICVTVPGYSKHDSRERHGLRFLLGLVT